MEQDMKGVTPMQLATKEGHVEVAKLLGVAEAKERESLKKDLAIYHIRF